MADDNQTPEEKLRGVVKEEVKEYFTDFKDTASEEIVKTVTDSIEKKAAEDGGFDEIKASYEDIKSHFDKLPDTVKDEVNARLEAMNKLSKESKSASDFMTWENLEAIGGRKNRFSFEMPGLETKEFQDYLERKSITTYDATPGGRQAAMAPWQLMYERNEFRPFVDYFPARGQTSVTLPEFTSASFGDTANTTAAKGGDETEVDVDPAVHILKSKTMQSSITNIAIETVPGLRSNMLAGITMRAGNKHGADCGAVVNASIKGANGFAKLKSGVAANTNGGLPAKSGDGNIQDIIDDAIAMLDTPYANAADLVIFCTRKFRSRFRQSVTASNGSLVWDGAERLMRYDGIRLVPTMHIPDPAAANDPMAWVCSLRYAVTLAEAVELRVEEYEETNPGSRTYFAQMIYQYIVRDTNALVGTVAGA